MSVRESFLNVVPQRAKVIASVLFSIAVTIGVVVGSLHIRNAAQIHTPIAGALVGLLGGTFVGSLFALWVLGLGYVYGDSRRRSMPAVAWTLLAALVPNLLGFLLYFVLRRPIALPCPQCGQSMTLEQRFCSWCGYQRPGFPSTAFPPPQPSAPAS